MKNIWKILIAVMTIVMTIALAGCPDSGTDTDDEVTVGTFVAGSGVFSVDGTTDSIATAWGGGPATPAFTVVLMTDQHRADMELVYKVATNWIKDADVSTPIYQIAQFGNLSFPTVKDGTFKVYGADGPEYTGVSVTIDGVTDLSADNTYSVKVDMSKIIITDLKMLAGGAELKLTKANSANLTGYKPYVLALKDKGLMIADYPLVGEGWSAKLVQMKSGATFPTTFDVTPEEIIVTLKITTTYDDTILLLTDVKAWKGFDTGIDGSPWSWGGGTATTFKAMNAGETIVVESNAALRATWADAQGLTAFKDVQPVGTDAFIKVKIGAEGFVPVKIDAETTFSWKDRK